MQKFIFLFLFQILLNGNPGPKFLGRKNSKKYMGLNWHKYLSEHMVWWIFPIVGFKCLFFCDNKLTVKFHFSHVSYYHIVDSSGAEEGYVLSKYFKDYIAKKKIPKNHYKCGFQKYMPGYQGCHISKTAGQNFIIYSSFLSI